MNEALCTITIYYKDGAPPETIKYNPHTANAFQLLEERYRTDPAFMIYMIDRVTFDE